MKGFLVKDYRQLIVQKNLLIILPIGLLFLFTNETPVMGISYTLYVITFLSNSLMAYDSFDNGMPFLMTLPGGRKNYVTAKYLFNGINSTVTMIFLLFVSSILEISRGKGIEALKELVIGTLLLYAVALMFSAVMLPVQLKYGQEKSRIVLMILFGIIFLGSMGIGKALEALNPDTAVIFEMLNRLSVAGIVAGVLALAVLITLLSFLISQNIMRKKNF